MDFSLKQTVLMLVTLMVVALSLSSLFRFFLDIGQTVDLNYDSAFYVSQINNEIKDVHSPVIQCNSRIITLDEEFDPLAGVTCNDVVDGDLSSSVLVYGTVDIHQIGTYELRYYVENSQGKKAIESVKIIVENKKEELSL